MTVRLLSLAFFAPLSLMAVTLDTPFDCLDMTDHPSGGQIYQEMRQIQKKMQIEYPELSSPATAVGYCEHLDRTHVFAFLVNGPLPLPSRCAGFTFSVQERKEAPHKAQSLTSLSTEYFAGSEGVLKLKVNGQDLRLPVCLDILDELIGSPEKPQESQASEKTESPK